MENKTTTKATVVLLRNSNGGICLAQKKKAIHHEAGEITYSLGMWNGYGGKIELEDEDIEDTAIRELVQESGVMASKKDLTKCGVVNFFWPNNETETPDMEVHFYFLDKWLENPEEGDEMGEPKFFSPNDIPYSEMMGGDRFLLPKMINGEFVQGNLYLGKIDEEGNPIFV